MDNKILVNGYAFNFSKERVSGLFLSKSVLKALLPVEQIVSFKSQCHEH